MIELPVTLTSTGGAVSFASPVTLGYTKNKGVYRLLITAEGEWQGLTIRCFWHLPGGTDPASSLVQDGFVDVPASVTAQPGTGCITFEGSDGEKTVTSADLRYKVGSNSGTEDGTMPEPGTPAWEQLVSETKANADAAERAKNDAQAAAEGVKTAAAKADEAAQKAEGAAQRAEAAQKATEQAEAAAAESIAGAKKEALSAISTGEQGALGAVQQAQTTATEAVQAAQTAAESAVNAAKTNAVQEVEAAAKPAQTAAAKAEEAAELSTQAGIAASNAADDAKRSAGIATDAAGDSALNAENAQKSALSAQQSAENAAESQSAAAASAAAAERNAEQAATDAKTANDAKTAAAGSADDAAGSAVAAGNSASAAAGSEQAAGASELKAAESEKAAKASEQASAKSAQAALESKTAAATSEGNAAASAKKAQDVADSLPADYMTAVNEIAALKTNKADKTELKSVKQQVANITPDDSSIGEKPWSSKHIIDMLCPPLEESGNPVVCYPVAGYPLGVKAKWEPVQEGSGTPSLENIRPIKGRDSVTITRQEDNQVITLTLPTTIYGGEVDAVAGEGQETRKLVTLDGTETWYTWGVNAYNSAVTGFYTYGINDYATTNTAGICSHLYNEKGDVWGGRNSGIGFSAIGQSRYFIFSVPTATLADVSDNSAAIASLKSYLAAQYAAGTPVQVCYKLAEPVPFTATGGGEIKALRGTNTLLTDGDTLTVTGREDLTHAISELRAAQATATKEK
jgi:hypothetical protein|nr:MAG TPA: hypothetical protein [Ackermannviridae sp.]